MYRVWWYDRTSIAWKRRTGVFFSLLAIWLFLGAFVPDLPHQHPWIWPAWFILAVAVQWEAMKPPARLNGVAVIHGAIVRVRTPHHPTWSGTLTQGSITALRWTPPRWVFLILIIALDSTPAWGLPVPHALLAIASLLVWQVWTHPPATHRANATDAAEHRYHLDLTAL